MDKINLTQSRRKLSQASYFCTKLKAFLAEIPDTASRNNAENAAGASRLNFFTKTQPKKIRRR